MIELQGEKLFTSEEICKMLNIHVRTLQTMRVKGLLHSVRIGKKKYTSEKALLDYLNGMTTEAIRKEQAAQKR